MLKSWKETMKGYQIKYIYIYIYCQTQQSFKNILEGEGHMT